MWSISTFFVCATLLAVVAQQLVAAGATLSSLSVSQELSGMVSFKGAAESYLTQLANRPESGYLAATKFVAENSGLASGVDNGRFAAYWSKAGSEGDGWLYVFPAKGGAASSDFAAAMSTASGRSMLVGSVVSTDGGSKAIDSGSTAGTVGLPVALSNLPVGTSIWAVPIPPATAPQFSGSSSQVSGGGWL